MTICPGIFRTTSRLKKSSHLQPEKWPNAPKKILLKKIPSLIGLESGKNSRFFSKNF